MLQCGSCSCRAKPCRSVPRTEPRAMVPCLIDEAAIRYRQSPGAGLAKSVPFLDHCARSVNKSPSRDVLSLSSSVAQNRGRHCCLLGAARLSREPLFGLEGTCNPYASYWRLPVACMLWPRSRRGMVKSIGCLDDLVGALDHVLPGGINLRLAFSA